MVRKINMWTQYNIKTFWASLETFLSRHLANAALEITSVLLCLFYIKKTIIHIYVYKKLKQENNTARYWCWPK